MTESCITASCFIMPSESHSNPPPMSHFSVAPPVSQLATSDGIQHSSSQPIISQSILFDDLNKRKPNFTESEKHFLVRQYENYRNILAARQSDISSNRMKSQIWCMISEQLNRRNPVVQRTPQEVRKKWQNLVTLARREVRESEQRGVATGQVPWIWRKVVDMSGFGSNLDEDEFGNETADESFGMPDGMTSADNWDMATVFKNEPPWGISDEAGETGPPVSTNSVSAISTENSPISVGDNDPAQFATPPVTTPLQSNHMSLSNNDNLVELPSRVEMSKKDISQPNRPSSAPERNNQPMKRQTADSIDRPPSRKRPHVQMSAICANDGLAANFTVPTLPMAATRSSHSPQLKADMAQRITYERWCLERSKRLMDLDQQRERFDFERRKLQCSVEMMEIEKEKLRLEVEMKRYELKKRIDAGF